MADGSVAYIHHMDGERARPRYVKPAAKTASSESFKDINAIFIGALGTTPSTAIDELAASLSLPPDSLKPGAGIDTAWFRQHCAFGFAMRDGNYHTIGVRLRNKGGEKWAIKGSKNGLFYPLSDIPKTVVIVEGPTDAAAVVSFGMFPIGRASCSSGGNYIMEFLSRNRHVKEAIIIADNDKPGLDGANALAKSLPVTSVVITLPCKDIRQFKNMGGTAKSILALARNCAWTTPGGR